MKTDPAMVAFLCKPENLKYALEVADAIDDVCQNIQAEFFGPIYKEISAKLSADPLGQQWRIEQGLDDAASNCITYGIWLVPEQRLQKYQLHYSLVTAIEEDDHYLYFGIDWGGRRMKQPEGFPGKAGKPLVEFLVGEGCESSEYTVGWKVLARFTGRKDLVLKLRERSEELGNEGCRLFWKLFTDTAPLVAAVNAGLKGRKG